MINGVTQLIMMKSDVLDSFETIKACVAYKVKGEEIEEFPYDICEEVEPVYVEMPGWKTDMTKMTSEDEFPEEFNAYLNFLEEELEVPVKIVSVGPDREADDCTLRKLRRELKSSLFLFLSFLMFKRSKLGGHINKFIKFVSNKMNFICFCLRLVCH